MTRFSIIIPAHDAGSRIAEAITSVLDQGRQDLEVIVVDDCSLDDTAQVAARIAETSDGTVQLLRLERNVGVSAARNIGVAASRGEVIVFLDADDIQRPGFLETIDAALVDDVDAVVVGHMVRTVDGVRPRSSRITGDLPGKEAARGAMRDAITPFPWDKAFRRSLLTDPPFPEGVHRFEDLAGIIVLLSRARSVRLLPDPYIEYRVSAGSLTWGRVPRREERDAAIAHVRTHMRGVPAKDLDALSVLLTVLIAQSAALTGNEPATLAACRADLTVRGTVRALRWSPTVGAAAVILRVSPRLFAVLVHRRTERKYGR